MLAALLVVLGMQHDTQIGRALRLESRIISRSLSPGPVKNYIRFRAAFEVSCLRPS